MPHLDHLWKMIEKHHCVSETDAMGEKGLSTTATDHSMPHLDHLGKMIEKHHYVSETDAMGEKGLTPTKPLHKFARLSKISTNGGGNGSWGAAECIRHSTRGEGGR